MQTPVPVPCDTNPVVLHTTDSSLCAGDSTILYAPLGYVSYLWSNGTTSASIKIKTAGTYSVIVTDAGGCQHLSNTINVQLFNLPPKPQIGFEGPQGICFGSPARLVTDAVGQIRWKNNAFTSFTDISNPTTAWVEVTDDNGCIKRSDTIQVDTLSIANASLSYSFPGISMCSSDSILITVQTDNHPYTFQWDNGHTGYQSWIIPETQMQGVTVIRDNGCVTKLYPVINENFIHFEFQTGGYFADPPVFYTCPGIPYLMTITPDAGHTYMWDDGDTSSIDKPLVGSESGISHFLQVTWNNVCSHWEEVIVKTNVYDDYLSFSADSICPGFYVLLNSTLTNEVWSNGSTNGSIGVNPLITTTYSVTGNNQYGCIKTLSKTIHVNQPPSFSISGLNTLTCLGDSINLFASGAANFSWSSNNNTVQGPNYHQPYNSQNSIKLKVTGINGCIKDSIFFPNIDWSAYFNFNLYDYLVCSEDSVVLDPTTGAGIYNWSTGSTDSVIVVSPDTTTTYSCTYTSSSGCSYTSNTPIYVYLDSVPYDTFYYEILAGDSVYLGWDTGYDHYLWNTGDTTSSIIAHPINNVETYTLIAYRDSGCALVKVFKITLDTLPLPYIIKPDTICFPDSVLLTCSEPGIIYWGGGAGPGQSAKLYTGGGLYFIAQFYYQRNSWSKQYLIRDTIWRTSTYPNWYIQGTDSICEGDIAQIKYNSILSTNSYLWDTGDTTSKIFVSPPVTTSYSLLVDNLGCSKTFNYTLKVNQRPPAPIIGGDTVICAGNSTTLTASSNYPILWNVGSALTSIHVSPDVDEVYSVYCKDEKLCRSDTTSTTVYVGSSAVSYIEGDEVICNGQSSHLVAKGFEDYTWSTGETTNAITVSPFVSSVYSVSGLNASGCSTTRHFLVNVNILPQQGSFLVCHPSAYCDSGKVIIAMNYFGFDSLVWSTGLNSQSTYFNPVVPQWLYLYAYSSCYASPLVDSLFMKPRGYFNARIDADTLVCAGAIVDLDCQLSVPGNFLWSNGSTSQSTYAIPSVTSTYSLTITGNNGCTETLYHTINVISNYSDSIVGRKNLCDGETTTFLNCTPVSGASYLWSNGSVTNESNYSLSNAVNPITVLITLNGGCSFLLKDTIRIHSNAFIPSISVPAQLCDGDSALISLNGGMQYQWISGASGTSSNQWVMPLSSTKYEADVIYFNDGSTICSTRVMDSILVLIKPEITVLGADQYFCPGSTVNLVASGANSYSWNGVVFNDSIT
ncbi:MAG: hypothetical protein ACKVQV_12545, partial [Bacteroidia bacterium]